MAKKQTVTTTDDTTRPMGIWRSAMYCISVGIRAITRVFTIVDVVSETGEVHATYFRDSSIAELEARKALAGN